MAKTPGRCDLCGNNASGCTTCKPIIMLPSIIFGTDYISIGQRIVQIAEAKRYGWKLD